MIVKAILMIKGRQIRAARALLDWSADRLAKEVGVSREAITKFEDEVMGLRPKNFALMIGVLDKNRIEFVGDRGVALKSYQIATFEGDTAFSQLLDDVVATMKSFPKPEALFACADDRVSPPLAVENYRRLRKAGIAMRSLVKEGDTYLMGKLNEYRYVPKPYFHNNATVIYGDKFATMILDPATAKDAAAVIIHNPHIAAAQRNLFNLIWAGARKPSESTAPIRYEQH
jgi:DNA-binding XRE family transcriptional regulator